MEPLLQETLDILPLLTPDFKKVSRATGITAAANQLAPRWLEFIPRVLT